MYYKEGSVYMVGPVQGGGSPAPVSGLTSGFSSSSGFSEQVFEDTLSTLAFDNVGLNIIVANNPLLPKPALFNVSQDVSLASVANKQNTYAASTAINLLTSTFYRNFIFDADLLLALLGNLVNLERQTAQIISQLNDSISNENNFIAAFNGGAATDTTKTTDINQAANTFNDAYALFQSQTEEFNQGHITPSAYAADQQTFNAAQSAYNSAVNTYNLYADQRNADIQAYNNSLVNYNTTAQDNNAVLNVINVQRAALNIPPIPLQGSLSDTKSTLPIASTSPPAPVTVPTIIDQPTVPQIPFYSPFYVIDLVGTIFFTVAQIQIAATNPIQKGLELIQGVRTYIDFYSPVKRTVTAIPPSFTSKQAETNSTTLTGASINAGLGSISSSLDPVVVGRLYNQGAQDSYYQAATSVLKPNTIDVTLVATANVLTSASLINGQRLAQQLKDSIQGTDIDETILDKALALGLVNELLNIISNNSVTDGIKEFASPEEKANAGFDSAANTLNATVNLSLAGLALNLLSTTLGLPGLGGQILGQAGLSTSDVFNVTSQGVGFNNFAFNPLTRNFFAEQLSGQIAQQLGLSPENQQNLQNALLEASLNTSPFAGQDVFINNLSTALGNNGITGPLAADITAAASTGFNQPAFTSRESFSNDLQQSLVTQGFTENDASQIAATIAGISSPSGETTGQTINTGSINLDLLAGNIAFNLFANGITTPSDIATKVAAELLKNTQEIAEATFRDDLRHQLEVAGLKQEVAARVAAGTAVPTTSLNNPLLQPVTTQLIAQNEIHDAVRDSITNVYSSLYTPAQAQHEAQVLADALVGPANANARDAQPLSLVNTIRDNLNVLKDQKDQIFFNKSVESFKDYLKPTVELTAFTQDRLLDPGRRIFYADDLIHAPPPTTGTVKIGGVNPALEVAA